jgi:hypothetical protein
VILTGTPAYTTDVVGRDGAQRGEDRHRNTIAITFSATVATATEVRIPYEEPAVRNRLGRVRFDEHVSRVTSPPPPAPLVLVAATFDPGEAQVVLTFDRAIDIAALDGTQITIDDAAISATLYDASGSALLLTPASVRMDVNAHRAVDRRGHDAERDGDDGHRRDGRRRGVGGGERMWSCRFRDGRGEGRGEGRAKKRSDVR